MSLAYSNVDHVCVCVRTRVRAYGTTDQTQGLAYVRHMIYHCSTPTVQGKNFLYVVEGGKEKKEKTGMSERLREKKNICTNFLRQN